MTEQSLATIIKRRNGQYFTKGNCFKLFSFKEWFNSIPGNASMTIVEPFAGSGDIPSLMQKAGYNNKWELYDLYPQGKDVVKNDSIAHCPKGKCIITNPPYLAKNSATRRGLKFPETDYDDLYKLALSKILDSALYVAAIIPESFITSGMFLNRISRVISLRFKMFDDTSCPVCLALFSPSDVFQVYYNNKLIGNMPKLKKCLPTPRMTQQWTFNSRKGDIGLIAIDNTRTNTIRFVRGETILGDSIKVSSRAITRILGNGHYNLDKLITEANAILGKLRSDTQDVFLTSFKGIRKDSKYRRRLDYSLARDILDLAYEHLT